MLIRIIESGDIFDIDEAGGKALIEAGKAVEYIGNAYRAATFEPPERAVMPKPIRLKQVIKDGG